MKTNTSFVRLITRKAFTIAFLGLSAFAAFATLGDGKGKGKDRKKSILSNQKVIVQPGNFSLKSGYGYQVPRTTPKYIIVNTNVTYQKGNTTYIVPVRKKVILGNVSFKLGIQRYNK